MARVPRGVGLRTRSGPEGSSLKRSPAGAAGAPEPEPRAATGDRRAESRRGVHGPLDAAARRRSATSGWSCASAKPGGTLDRRRAGRAGRACSRVRLPCSRGRRRRRGDRARRCGADDVRRARLQVQRQQRDGRVVGHPHRAAAQRDRVVATSASRSPSMLCWRARLSSSRCAARYCDGRVGEQRDEHERRRRPSTASARVAGRQPRPAEHARRRRTGTGSPRRGTRSGCRSAGRRGERGEHEHREHAGDGARERARVAATAARAPRRARRRRAPAGAGSRRCAAGCTRARSRSP